MSDFFNRFYKEFILAGVVVIAGITFLIPQGEEIRKWIGAHLSEIVGWLGVIVLLWLWKFDKDWKQALKSEISPKVEEHEDRVRQLWDAFCKHATDAQLEREFREILTLYPSIVLQQDDSKIGKQVRETIRDVGDMLRCRKYTVYFDEVNVYPGPFYKSAKKSIIATNIGGPGNFWGDREKLVAMNQEAVARIQPTLQEGEHAIRRVFIIEGNTKKGEIDELKKLMDELRQAGVAIRYLGLKDAEKLLVTTQISLIKRLEDFTVFDTENKDLKYAGRFENPAAIYKKVIISSEPRMIESLTDHFEALWNASDKFKGDIEPLYQLVREPNTEDDRARKGR